MTVLPGSNSNQKRHPVQLYGANAGLKRHSIQFRHCLPLPQKAAPSAAQ